MSITIQAGDVDVTTIKVNLKYPTNYFDLYSWDLCPYSLKVQLAFEYKLLYYKDIEYSISQVYPYSFNSLKKMESKTGHNSVPQLKINYKQGVEETWIHDSTAICKLLDSVLPANSLFYADNPGLHLEVALLEDWIDEAFKLPYLRLLFLNKNNLAKATQLWTKGEDSLINKAYLEIFKKERINYCTGFASSKDKALSEARRRFDEDLLPLICDRLELIKAQGFSFILGQNLTAADLALYSFLKLILEFEEGSLINRRYILQSYLEAVSSTPLDKVCGHLKGNVSRHKLSILSGRKQLEEEETL